MKSTMSFNAVESNYLMRTLVFSLSLNLVNITWKYGLADAKIILCPGINIPSRLI